MRSPTLLFLLVVGCLLSLSGVFSLSWSKEDQELFSLQSQLRADAISHPDPKLNLVVPKGQEKKLSGAPPDFYGFLGVRREASVEEIGRAYRKRSLTLHPDKNPNNPIIHARFTRLGVVTGILRDPVKRARYDHFLKNGFPTWRGTDYLFSRFRPSLTFVLLLLIAFSCAIQFLVGKMNERKDRERVEYFRRGALGKAYPGGGGSGKSTPRGLGEGDAGVDKAEALELAMKQIDSSVSAGTEGNYDSGNASDASSATAGAGAGAGQQPKMTRRQARSRETRKEVLKRQTEGREKKSAVVPGVGAGSGSGAVTPVGGAGGSGKVKGKEVRVPFVEGGLGGRGEGLELVVVGDEVMLKETGEPLTSLIRARGITTLWPISLTLSGYHTVLNLLTRSSSKPTSNAAEDSFVDEDGDEEEYDIVDQDEIEGEGEGTGGIEAEGKKGKKKKAGGKAEGMRRRRVGK